MFIKDDNGISDARLRGFLEELYGGRSVKKVLILPPDFTRMYSGAGKITAILNEMFLSRGARVDIMPALGTHAPMTAEESMKFFGPGVDPGKLIVHNWRTDVVKLGEVPADFVSSVSEGLVNDRIDVEVNRLIADPSYDLIVSVGQVVPHEVVGMANYSKNIFVGCGGSSMINSSHMLGAFYGLERIMGRDFSPVRKVFDYAQEHFLAAFPISYIMTVTTSDGGETVLRGIYSGEGRRSFEQAVGHSQDVNLVHMKEPIKKAVVYLDPSEFKSTWLGNKAVYRTRMAIADGGSLVVLAPGVRRFGEDDENDRLIRKYGYVGRKRILELVAENEDLRANLSVAAHLIHGSSDGRFSITYCTRYLTEREVRGAGFDYMPYGEAARLYDPETLTDGEHDGFYYISNPALGLWTVG
ncbi:MAG: DUF2088 domain-containing protein [Clostridia bacterium]|nr:DUF2088 domain-containing protein [Clostridia bacterium]